MQGTEPNLDTLAPISSLSIRSLDKTTIEIRQHSQDKAIEILKLKQALNELSIEDLTPAKLKSLADYFDADVLGATK